MILCRYRSRKTSPGGLGEHVPTVASGSLTISTDPDGLFCCVLRNAFLCTTAVKTSSLCYVSWKDLNKSYPAHRSCSHSRDCRWKSQQLLATTPRLKSLKLHMLKKKQAFWIDLIQVIFVHEHDPSVFSKNKIKRQIFSRSELRLEPMLLMLYNRHVFYQARFFNTIVMLYFPSAHSNLTFWDFPEWSVYVNINTLTLRELITRTLNLIIKKRV